MKFKINLNKKVKLVFKILFVSTVLLFVVREFSNIIKSFNMQYFLTYRDRLTWINLLIIGVLGIISYIPLSFYDFILKKEVGIKLNNMKLYKYSWIASSISSLLGFGGATSLAFKQYFYGNYVNDKKKLLKEIGKIVALNLTGLSLICIIYVFLQLRKWESIGLVKYPIIIISLYTPILIVFLIYKYIRTKDSKEFFCTLSIIGISFSEWLTTVILIYSTIKITGASITVFQFLPVYVEAAVLGILSMIPGGLGTFDLAFMEGLKALNIPIEQTLLVTILYRISYFIVPATIGVILYVHDFGKKVNEKFQGIPKEILSTIAYKILIVLVFISGSVIVLANIAPDILYKIKFIKILLAQRAIGFSIGISVIIGFLIILASLMIKYKSKGIYKITISLLALSIIFSFSRGIKLSELIFLLMVSYLVYLSRDKFYRKTFVVTWKNIIKDTIILIISFITYFYIVARYSKHLSVNSIHYLSYKMAYKMGIIALAIVIVIYVAIYFLNRDLKLPVKTFDECKDDINNILESYNGTSLTHLIFLKDKYVYLNEDKDVLFQYEVFVDKLFVLGNPIGNKEKILGEIEKFCNFADTYGYTPVFYQIDDTMINYLHSNGYDFMKLGEEAKIEIDSFKVVGNKMKNLKAAKNKMIKEGYTFEVLYPPFSKDLMNKLKKISDEWLENRKEKGFSVGFFDEDYLNRAPIAIIKDCNGDMKAFSNIMYMYDKDKSFSVDLMRFTKNSPTGLMDFIFINLIEQGKVKGFKTFNMGMAPLANVGVSKYAFLSERLALQLYENGQFLYSFKGLRKFKEKYTDKWEDRYIAYRRSTSLPIIMLQAALLCSRGKNQLIIMDKINDVLFLKV
ncbi:bifunctional lysylphosphatidylglycerol flippase/synthetase MprF [Clostridium tarantellae]|uniref:Bifunctional lysylphosphatidylglycerol flippase/synthetase MprF n=1 Tax=Clostridium tarantellae TaxID=39493 RepID=A0A6I1MUN9_9CLOT|nr:bifunctional lysylphosphatidylglycerol flippase/synthetase MprF [Clostridium tarantellae]MPQ44551.1 bifunctional lysylphosphatidylglycerol flippase/synthetase MprF [Clostridium tarantellae]